MARLHIRPQPAPVQRPPRAKRWQRRSEPAAMEIQPRDVEVLKAVAEHRFLCGDQIRRLVLRCRPATARRRLRLLYDHRLLERYAVPAEPALKLPLCVYGVTARAVELLAANDIAVQRSRPPSWVTLRHRYVVNECEVVLREAARSSGRPIVEWRHAHELRFSEQQRPPQPDPVTDSRWRDKAGQVKPIPILPDAYFQLGIGNGRTLAFFLEVDLSTHALSKWTERAYGYTAYHSQGRFQQRYGRNNFRLLVVCRPDRRRRRQGNILGTIKQAIGNSDMFLATTLDQLTAKDALSSIWQPATEQPVRLPLLPGEPVRVAPAARGGTLD